MKDLERIKSEDLGCQVQDANPGNFAIEQEVAALVGATLPAPTAPSADDARELGAQLLVFLRRALLPIRSALRTAVAAIYAHLDSRCTDYTPAAYASYQPLPSYDPMRPFVPRTLPNLLTALTAFSARKISNGSAPSDGIPDGTSLARLLYNTTDASAVTEIKDDTYGWQIFKDTMPTSVTGLPLSTFPNIKKLTLNCIGDLAGGMLRDSNTLEELNIPYIASLKRLPYYYAPIWNLTALKVLYAPQVTVCRDYSTDYPCVHNCNNLERIVLGKIEDFYDFARTAMPNLIDFEIGAGTAVSLNLSFWQATNVLADADKTATFLQNFREHIALRLAQQPADNPNHLTLTLSQAVFDTIWNGDGTPKSTDPDSVIYQINKIIKTDKHWSVNRA